MSVVLVTRDSPFGRYLACSLLGVRAIDRVIIERGRTSQRFYRRKLRRVGLVNAVFQFLLNRAFHRAGERLLPHLTLPPHDVVDTINGCRFGANDLVIGFGTSFVTAATLAGIPRGMLNLHTGWLPDYRGVKSEFHVLAAGDTARTGWTLHYMTPRLDEGDIVLRRAVHAGDVSAPELRVALVRDAVPMLAEFIERVRRDGFGAITRTPQGDGRYFTTPTLRDWWRYRRARRPVRAEAAAPLSR